MDRLERAGRAADGRRRPRPITRCSKSACPGHGEPVDELQMRGILLDGSTEDDDPRLLLQIFGQPQIGPVFFEFIQRKKDEGFGEGNFTALFKSMEADQIPRARAAQVPEPAEMSPRPSRSAASTTSPIAARTPRRRSTGTQRCSG